MSGSVSLVSQVSEQQDITIYCFCNDTFSTTFPITSSKQIGLLKDKQIEIKFFKNLIELIK